MPALVGGMRESDLNAARGDRMLDLAARDMAIAGATIERIAGRGGFGGCVRARFPDPRGVIVDRSLSFADGKIAVTGRRISAISCC